jgi:hypothetical protein
MAMLSIELNRFLGTALLDPRVMRQVFGSNRTVALQGFGFTPSETAAILSSKAQSLADLSGELTAKFAQPDGADADMQVEYAYQSLHLHERPATAQFQKMVQRVIGALDDSSQVEAVHLRMAS